MSLLAPIVIIVLFLLFPVVSVLISSFVDGDGFTFQYLGAILRDGYYYKLFAITFSQATLSTLVSLIIGIPIGYFFGKYDFKGRKFLLTFFTVPFVLPSVLVGMGFLSIFGEQNSNGAKLILIVLAHAFYNIPLFVHFISAYYRNFDNDIIEAAKTSGSKNFHLLFRIYLPLFLVPILTASLLTFVFSFLSFGIIIILGDFKTIETQIFSEYNPGETNLAAALALVQLFVILSIVLFYLIYMRRQTREKKTITTGGIYGEPLSFRKFFKKKSNILLITVLLFGFLLELAPMISIFIKSFWDPQTASFTLGNFKTIFTLQFNSSVGTSIPRTLLNTLLFALGATVIATLLAVITVVALGKQRRRKRSISYELITYLPITISSLTLSLGILQTFTNSDFFINNPWIFIIISQGLLGYPFVTRALLNGLNTIDPELLDSAKTMGANWYFKLRKIYLPLLLPSIVAGIAFAFGLSIGEFTVANFFAINNSSISTLTVALYKLRSQRHFGPSNAVGALLMLISYAAFFILEALGAREKTASKISVI
ncbi:MAG: iron ABC transporter permease [Candidatus Heimdallarchaeota archaeon]|nr:iron ABC transporter permease [Candidatus Heimdallarchaeota archaeon]MCG3252615.1 iron ABC transporter permease [Candidatus Heimdallarchaeota archaeon]MCK4289753.1 iron ABC transporter permease [Candidatus Heimdallarchaeota archaeon]